MESPEERAVYSYLTDRMPELPDIKTKRLSHIITGIAKRHGISPGLILAVIRVESNFRSWAVSPRGALGLMQLMPETGEWLAHRHGLDWSGPASLLDEETNATMGVLYLAYLKEKYSGDLRRMLSAYNRGPAKVDEEVSEGRFGTLDYYSKIRQYLPKLAYGRKTVAYTNVD
jgi:soluble lytic murein transglycosylase